MKEKNLIQTVTIAWTKNEIENKINHCVVSFTRDMREERVKRGIDSMRNEEIETLMRVLGAVIERAKKSMGKNIERKEVDNER